MTMQSTAAAERERILCAASGLRASVLADDETYRAGVERELLAAGVRLPVSHRLPWARTTVPARSRFVVIRDSSGAVRGGYAVSVRSSRALPGFVVLRAERLGPGLPPGTREIALTSLVRLAREEPRVLRVYAELFDRADSLRADFVTAATAAGFRLALAPRSYPRTITLDLQQGEDELLRSFSRSTRRNITKLTDWKLPLELRPVTELSYVPRMTELLSAVYARTGGALSAPELAQPVLLSRDAPSLSRLVGLFRTDCEGPASLLGFAWGKMQGDCASYDTGASTRYEGRSVGIAYPLVWDLMRWARAQGAAWFDLGGVTDGSHGSDDRLGGISDFKRSFGGDITLVGVDVELEPSAARAYAADAVRAGVRLAARFRDTLRVRGVGAQPAERTA